MATVTNPRRPGHLALDMTYLTLCRMADRAYLENDSSDRETLERAAQLVAAEITVRFGPSSLERVRESLKEEDHPLVDDGGEK